MPPVSGATITGPLQGTVLAEQTFPTPRPIRLTVMISATYNFFALLEIWDEQGRVVYDVVLPVTAPIWTSPEMGPLNMAANGRVRVVSRNTPEVTPGPLEVQATILARDWGER